MTRYFSSLRLASQTHRNWTTLQGISALYNWLHKHTKNWTTLQGISTIYDWLKNTQKLNYMTRYFSSLRLASQTHRNWTTLQSISALYDWLHKHTETELHCKVFQLFTTGLTNTQRLNYTARHFGCLRLISQTHWNSLRLAKHKLFQLFTTNLKTHKN